MADTATYKVYKPFSKDGKLMGAASQLDYRPNTKKNDSILFWTMTKQTGEDENGNASFGWKDSKSTVKMKLGLPDVGELLAVLKGLKESVGTKGSLFHKNPNGNTSLNFARDGDKYRAKLSSQDVNKNVVSVTHNFTLGESVVLEAFLQRFLDASFSQTAKLDKVTPVKQ